MYICVRIAEQEVRLNRTVHKSSTLGDSNMSQREFEITIAADGSVELHIKGYKGKACLEVVKAFEAIVGPAAIKKLTSEFYEPEEKVKYHLRQNQ
jgi:hypothetical protein